MGNSRQADRRGLGFAGKKDRRQPLDNPPRDSTVDFIVFMADGRLAELAEITMPTRESRLLSLTLL